MLRQIISHSRQKMVAGILRWVTMAVQPLTISELGAAIEGSIPATPLLSRERVLRDQILSCGYFLKIDGDKINLLHQSVKDYLLREQRDPDPELERFRIDKYATHLEIAKRCLQYLDEGAFAEGASKIAKRYFDPAVEPEYPLTWYAARHWPHHPGTLSPSESIFDFTQPLCRELSTALRNWVEIRAFELKHKDGWDYHRSPRGPNLSGQGPLPSTLLQLASFFGILPLAERLLSVSLALGLSVHVPYINEGYRYSATALMFASRQGHTVLARLLLDNGALIDTTTGKFHCTALAWACAYGKTDTARLLIEAGAEVNFDRSREGRKKLNRTTKPRNAVRNDKELRNSPMSHLPGSTTLAMSTIIATVTFLSETFKSREMTVPAVCTRVLPFHFHV